MNNLLFAQIAVASLLLTALLTLETVIPFVRGRNHRVKNAILNTGIGIFNSVVVAFIFGTMLVFTIKWGEIYGIGLMSWFKLPIIISAVLGVLFLDAWMYIWHRANHRLPILWRFHKVHHSDSEMDVTTSVRFHTGEILISALLRLGVVLVLGLSLWQVLLYDLLLIPFVFFHHSNVRFPEKWDSWLRMIFTSPSMHRIHHSPERISADSNYGSIFSFWDRLAHSFRIRKSNESVQYGLAGIELKESLQFTTLALMPLRTGISTSEGIVGIRHD